MRVSKGLIFALLAFFLVSEWLPSEATARRKRKAKTPPQFVVLDGIRERVFWNDGDSFRITRGPRKGFKARLADYNTLESYGPVHFWGGYNAWDMYLLAKKGTKLARSKEWKCTAKNTSGGYGRVVVHCPGLSEAILKAGYAHLFTVGKTRAPAKLIRIQREAQNKRRGIWKRGIPSWIVTSIHSMDEPTRDGSMRKKAYNRICDTVTGRTRAWNHTATFKACDAFCWGGSCMLYVPFKVRYGKNRPFCMRQGWKSRMVPAPPIGTPMAKKKRN